MSYAARIQKKGISFGWKLIGFMVVVLVILGFLGTFLSGGTPSEGEPGYIPTEQVEEQTD